MPRVGAGVLRRRLVRRGSNLRGPPSKAGGRGPPGNILRRDGARPRSRPATMSPAVRARQVSTRNAVSVDIGGQSPRFTRFAGPGSRRPMCCIDVGQTPPRRAARCPWVEVGSFHVEHRSDRIPTAWSAAGRRPLLETGPVRGVESSGGTAGLRVPVREFGDHRPVPLGPSCRSRAARLAGRSSGSARPRPLRDGGV